MTGSNERERLNALADRVEAEAANWRGKDMEQGLLEIAAAMRALTQEDDNG